MSRSVSSRAATRRASGHMPRLDTIQMVEKTIKGDRTFSSKNQLWRSLPKQVQYPTFVKILDYLEQSNKIMYERDGTIVWTFVDSAAARKSLRESRQVQLMPHSGSLSDGRETLNAKVR